MTYSQWQLRPFLVKLRDPDRTVRVDRFPACIGVHDARSQATWKWPLSEVLEVKPEVTEAPHSVMEGERQICSACGCWWRDELHAKDEWCSEPLLGGTCLCHAEQFWANEEVLAEIEPFSSFADDVA